tara:strand:+ start:52 stop:489 length:438 start_codon:yes stop_codon:yes gene_type:complete
MGRLRLINSKENFMLKNTIPLLFTIYYISYNSVYAGCGSCNVSKTKVPDIHTNLELVSQLSDEGLVSGFVLASCGMCNFAIDSKSGCSLAIKIGESTYQIKGTSIDDHGDSHAKDGFCSAVRVASVVGNVKDNICFVKTFDIVKE